MRLNKTATAAAFALVAPVAVGFTVTAGASVGGGSADIFNHEVDEIAVDGYLVNREEVDDDPVSIVVTDPDGDQVDPAGFEQLPSPVAETVDRLSADDWSPVDPDPFAIVDGVPCYDPAVEADTTVWSSSPDEGTYVLEVDGDGEVVQALHFAPGIDHGHDEFEEAVNDGTAAELAGAEPLPACR